MLTAHEHQLYLRMFWEERAIGKKKRNLTVCAHYRLFFGGGERRHESVELHQNKEFEGVLE